MSDERPPPITHVAVRFRGQVYSLPAPNRHHHVLWMIREQTGIRPIAGESQGFLDADGKYLTREEAMVNAKANGQLGGGSQKYVLRDLFSENLW